MPSSNFPKPGVSTPKNLDLVFSGETDSPPATQDKALSSVDSALGPLFPSQSKKREDGSKKNSNQSVIHNLGGLFRGSEDLEPPIFMEGLFDSLSAVETNLDRDADTLQALPDDLQDLLVRVADRVRDLRSQAVLDSEVPALGNITEFWDERDKSLKESPLEFVQRVYADYIFAGISKADIKRADPKLYRAIYNWAARGNSIPAELFSSKSTLGRKRRWDSEAVSEQDIEIYRKVDAIRKR